VSERQRGGRNPGSAGDEWLHAAVRATLSGPADGCPDASEVAAFAEGRLDAGERERFERHAASCQRCLDLLGTLAQVDEAFVPAAEVRAGASWSWWRWLVPATVAATAAGVYLLVQPAAPVSHVPVAEEPAPAVVADGRLPERSGQVVGGAVPRDEEKPSAATAPQPARPSGAPSAPGQAVRGVQMPAGRGLETPVGRDFSPGQPPQAPEPKAKQDAAAPAVADQALAVPSKRVAVSAETGAAAPVAVPAERELAVAEQALRPQAAGGQPSAAVARGKGLDSAAHWVEASAPGGTERWRFGPGTAVSRSLDGGRTWQPGTTPAAVTAASCPVPSTCWAVGRRGVVIATADGVTWRRIPFPDPSDLVTVAASDAIVATVTTASGTRYATTDGGATWTAAPRQF
jgi:hypothetical protein